MIQPADREVLLVEDNPGDVLLVQEAFADAELPNHLSVVMDGEQAIAYLRREAPFANSRRPHLILLDLNLPKKDGREVLKFIKSEPALSGIPVLILTTSSDSGDVRRAYELHANCYLRKPVDMEEFFSLVRAIGDFWLNRARIPLTA